jgi:hypothetical protein
MRFCFFFALDGAGHYEGWENVIVGGVNAPGVSETLYIINASPLFVLATSSNFFHSTIQELLSMDLVSSSAAEFIVSTATDAFWYFLQSDATIIILGSYP